MSIDKSISQSPLGLGALMEQPEGDGVEIEIENPDAVNINLGGMEISIIPHGKGEFDQNLAEDMDEGELQNIASDLIEMVEADIQSRKDWVEMYVKGLEVLGMNYEERTEPWTGACGVFSTILTEAAIRFQSETITESFPAQGPVQTQIIGDDTPETQEAAERVRTDMNYQLVEVMTEYRPEHERMLYNLGLAGSAFKKIYFDPSLNRQTAMFIPAEEIIIPYGASSVHSAERVTHIMRKTKNDIRKLQASGFYRDIDLGEPDNIHTDVEKKKADGQGYTLTDDDRYQIYEIHVDYDLPGFEDKDGIALPYIVTIDKSSNEVLAIRRNWDEKAKVKTKQNHFVQYNYVPGFGAYGLGLIHLIGGYARAGTSIIRQLVDAGTLSNLPGGMKTKGLRVKGDDTPIGPGEFRDVDIPSGTLRDNIMPLPYKEPSQVLLALLNQITEEGRRLGSIADINTSDMGANAPVGTTLALLERQLKTMSAVQARVHYSMKQEFKLLKEIIREYTPKNYSYTPEGGDRKAKQSDYDLVEIIPVSDPNSTTMAQRIMQYQAVIQLSQGAPQIYNLPQLHRQMIEVLGIKNADKLVPIDDDMKPRDPISENMAFLNGKPTKAFMYQDHEAHIQAHTSFMTDPLIAQTIGQNPQASQIGAAINSHIAEHLGYLYRQKIQDRLGAPLPLPDADIPPEIEVQLSQVVAQAAQQLKAMNTAQQAQQQAAQQAQDPIIQMQMQELQLKGQEVQIKGKKVDADIALQQQKLQMEAQKTAPQQPMMQQPAPPQPDPRVIAAQQQAQLAQQAQQQQLEVQAHQALVKKQAMEQEVAQKAEAHRQDLLHRQQAHQQKLILEAQKAALNKKKD
jgi:hypothetical protein